MSIAQSWSDFKVQIGGRPAMTGSQRIGWDPLAESTPSWVFDSSGGVAEGVWTRNDNQWIIKTTGVTHEGKPALATNILTRAGETSDDLAIARSRGRWRGDPGIYEEIIIVPNAAEAQITEIAGPC